MNSLSAARIGATLVVSAMLIPFAAAQSGAREQNPPQQRPDSTGTPSTKDTSKVRDSERTGEAQSGRMDYLARAKQTVGSATFTERKQVLSMLKETLKAGHDEQERLHEAAEELKGASHEQFEDAEKIAESSREHFEESYEELEDAEVGQWDTRKAAVAASIEQYSSALERARALAGPSTLTPQR
jgi:hypothetical protein